MMTTEAAGDERDTSENGAVDRHRHVAQHKAHRPSSQPADQAAVVCCDSVAGAPVAGGRRFVAVRLLTDETLFFHVDAKRATVASLKSRLCSVLDVKQCDLFGLGQYFASGDEHKSAQFRLVLDEQLRLSKIFAKVWKCADAKGLDAAGQPSALFHFGVKVFVDYSSIIRCDNSLYYYYLTLRKNMLEHWQLAGSVPNNELVLEIAAFALQADFGDRAFLKGRTRYFAPAKYLPQWVVTSLGSEQAIRYLVDLHCALHGVSRTRAMRLYCDRVSPAALAAQCGSCASPAEHLFAVRTAKGDKCDNAAVGIACKGVAVYKVHTGGGQQGATGAANFELVASYDWPDIAKLAYDKRRFVLIGLDSVRRSFYTHGADANSKTRYMLDLCKVVHSRVMQLHDQLTTARVHCDGAQRTEYRESYIWSDESDKQIMASRPQAHTTPTAQQTVANADHIPRRCSMTGNSDSASTATTSGIVSDNSRPALPPYSQLEQAFDWKDASELVTNSTPAQKTCSVSNLCGHQHQNVMDFEHSAPPVSSVSSWSLWQWRKCSDTGTLIPLQQQQPQPCQAAQQPQQRESDMLPCVSGSREVNEISAPVRRGAGVAQKRWTTLTDGVPLDANVQSIQSGSGTYRSVLNAAQTAGLSQSTNEIATLLELVDDESRRNMLEQLRAAAGQNKRAAAQAQQQQQHDDANSADGATAGADVMPPLAPASLAVHDGHNGQLCEPQLSGVYSKNARGASSKTKLNVACARAAAMHSQHNEANYATPVFSIKRAQSAYGSNDAPHYQNSASATNAYHREYGAPIYADVRPATSGGNLAVYAVPSPNRAKRGANVHSARSETDLASSSRQVGPCAAAGLRQPPSYEDAVASLRARSHSLLGTHVRKAPAALPLAQAEQRCGACQGVPTTSSSTSQLASSSNQVDHQLNGGSGGTLRAAVAHVRAHGRRKLPFLHALLRDSATDLQYTENNGSGDKTCTCEQNGSAQTEAQGSEFRPQSWHQQADLDAHIVTGNTERLPPPYPGATPYTGTAADRTNRCVSVPDMSLYTCAAQQSMAVCDERRDPPLFAADAADAAAHRLAADVWHQTGNTAHNCVVR